MIRFRMLGTVDLRDSQGRELPSVLRRPKLLGLLAYLGTARPAGFHRRDALVALLWPDLDNAHARNALRQAVHALRETLGHDALLSRGEEELAVNGERLLCDIREFEITLEAGDAEKALEVYRGSLLSGFHLSGVPEFERWLDKEREHARRRACEAARLLTDSAVAAENVTAAAHWAFRLTELSPSDDTAVQRLIELLDRAGDRAGAVRAYEEFERRLTRDLELAPSPETEALVRSIRARRQHGAIVGIAEVAVEPRDVGTTNVEESATSAPVISSGAVGGDAAMMQPNDNRSRRARSAATAPKRIATLLALVVGSLLMAAWFMFRPPFGARSTVADRAPTRLVIIPFANLGPAEDGYFAAGITEEIGARLGAIKGIRIIGSASANRYRNSKKTLSEIDEELHVDYVLEGSVRWQKSLDGPARVRITPELVSIKDGTRRWAQVYDEPLDAIFRVQSDVAAKVVQALDIVLSDPQRTAVAAAPTRNLEAYDFYLRGNDYGRRGYAEPTIRAAAQMYEKAVELDPSFALAYTQVSRMSTRMFWAYFDHSKKRLEQARSAADRAMRLRPDIPESHQALAIYYGLGIQNYSLAMSEYSLAEARGANPGFVLGRATVRVRQGAFREALADYEKARQADPAGSGVFSNSGLPYDLLREYARAEALYDRAITLAPDLIESYLLKSWLYMRWDGSTQRARTVLSQAERAGIATQPAMLYARVLMEIFDRQYDKALALLSSDAPEIIVADQARLVPRAQLYALVYGLTNRPDQSKAYFDTCRRILSRKVEKDPDDPRLRTALGIAYAGLGQKQDAIQQGLKAVELMPIRRDAFKGYHHEWELTRIYMMVGESDLAISKLEYLLSIPGQLSAAWLRMDPVWDPLRNQPRFRKLVGLSN